MNLRNADGVSVADGRGIGTILNDELDAVFATPNRGGERVLRHRGGARRRLRARGGAPARASGPAGRARQRRTGGPGRPQPRRAPRPHRHGPGPLERDCVQPPWPWVGDAHQRSHCRAGPRSERVDADRWRWCRATERAVHGDARLRQYREPGRDRRDDPAERRAELRPGRSARFSAPGAGVRGPRRRPRCADLQPERAARHLLRPGSAALRGESPNGDLARADLRGSVQRGGRTHLGPGHQRGDRCRPGGRPRHRLTGRAPRDLRRERPGRRRDLVPLYGHGRRSARRADHQSRRAGNGRDAVPLRADERARRADQGHRGRARGPDVGIRGAAAGEQCRCGSRLGPGGRDGPGCEIVAARGVRGARRERPVRHQGAAHRLPAASAERPAADHHPDRRGHSAQIRGRRRHRRRHRSGTRAGSGRSRVERPQRGERLDAR